MIGGAARLPIDQVNYIVNNSTGVCRARLYKGAFLRVQSNDADISNTTSFMSSADSFTVKFAVGIGDEFPLGYSVVLVHASGSASIISEGGEITFSNVTSPMIITVTDH